MKTIEQQLGIIKNLNEGFSNAIGVSKEARQTCGVRPPATLVPKFLQTKQMKENVQRWNDCVSQTQNLAIQAKSQNIIDQQIAEQQARDAAQSPQGSPQVQGISTTGKIALGVTAVVILGTTAYLLFR